MRHKRALIISAIVTALVLAIAGGAYAYFTTTAAIADNSVTAGTLSYTTGVAVGDKIVAENLMPSKGPDDGGAFAGPYYFYVSNNANADTMFYGYVDNVWESVAGFSDHVMVKVTLGPTDSPWGSRSGWWHDLSGAPSPDGWAVYTGALSGIVGQTNGKDKLSSRHGSPGAWVHDLFKQGDTAVYKMVMWLDAGTGDEFQGASLTCSLKFWGTQADGWTD